MVCDCVSDPVHAPHRVQVHHREGRARHARQAIRPPRLSSHWGPLEPPAGLLPETQAHQQPPGPIRTRESAS